MLSAVVLIGIGVSFFGICVAFYRKLDIPFAYTPALAAASISSVLFFAGLLNTLNLAVYVIYAAGICGVGKQVLSVCKSRKYDFDRKAAAILLLWLGFLIYFKILLAGAHFIHYDNFSHWGLVVRNMLENGRMPNFQDKIIQFQTYPLGSALFVYYFCKLTRSTEAFYMLANTMLTVSFLFPLLSFVKDKLTGLVFVLFSVFALSCNIKPTELLVDTMMPLAGVSLFCILYEDKICPRLKLLLAVPFVIFLANVKTAESSSLRSRLCIGFGSTEVRSPRGFWVYLCFFRRQSSFSGRSIARWCLLGQPCQGTP